MRKYKLYTEPVQQGLINGHDALFRAVFDESPDAIFLLHPGSFEIVDCNAKALQLFQAVDKSELTGRESFTLYDSEPVDFSKTILIDTINKGMEHTQELAFRSLQGNIFWGRTSIRKVDTMGGSLIVFRVRRVVDFMKTAEMLDTMVKQTAKVTGLDFFSTLTEMLSKAFGVTLVMIAKIDQHAGTAEAVHTWHNSHAGEKFSFDLFTSPSYNVLKGYTTFYPSNLQEMFPDDLLVRQLNLVSYMGTPVYDSLGNVIGLVILMDEKPMQEVPNSRYILTLMASRAGIEMERIAGEEMLRSRIGELTRASEQKDIYIHMLEQQLGENTVLCL